MTASPCWKLAAELYPWAAEEDVPAEALDAVGIMRRAMAEEPPATLSEAATMAEELAAMVAAGECLDGIDVKMANALAQGLADLRTEVYAKIESDAEEREGIELEDAFALPPLDVVIANA